MSAEGRRRIYHLEPQRLAAVGDWLEQQRERWSRSLDALESGKANEA
ncbi:hypothetical protein [Saccharopolyspora antimicrobica]|nr:hypothetical protein [Saccharopolyspora antimicrobica]